MVLWLPSVLVSLTLFIRHSTRPFSIPSAPRGTREECNDDRRAETPERMGCGMERGLRDKHSIFRKLSVLQLYPCGWNNLGCMEVTASLITFKYLTYLYLIIMLLGYLLYLITLYYFFIIFILLITLYYTTSVLSLSLLLGINTVKTYISLLYLLVTRYHYCSLTVSLVIIVYYCSPYTFTVRLYY